MVSRKIKPTTVVLQPRNELLSVAEAVAREKGIEHSDVIFAMEQAILKAAKIKYGIEHDIRVELDRTSGQMSIARVKVVVDEVQDPFTEITLAEALRMDTQSALGDEIFEELPLVDLGRVTAQNARQVIFQKVRDAERNNIYNEYKERVGDIISGLVKRVEFNNVIIDLNPGEGILRKEDLIPRENFRIGDRVRVIITEIRPDAKGPMIILSRTHPHFMARLFEHEVPEIYDGIIEIKGISRDPGSRAKIAVYTADVSIDPVGSCVGVRGSRVQSIINEFGGEKVDIIPWSENAATYIVNALAPAEVVRVVLDEELKRVQVVVAESQLSLAIGRRGQNVRLATQLTGWHIDIVTEEEDTAKRTAEFEKRTHLFKEALDVDDTLAYLLVAEGFETIEELYHTDIHDLLTIEGFDEDIAQEIQNRANAYLENRQAAVRQQCLEQGMTEQLITFGHLPYVILEKLCAANILTLTDLADLASDEMMDIVGTELLSAEDANHFIMEARAQCFGITCE